MAYVAFASAGLIVGLCFSLIYAVIYVLSGGLPTVDDSVISVPTALLVYTVTGVVGGVVAAMFRNLYDSKVWATVAGIVSLAPMIVAGAYLYYGSAARIDWLGVLVIAVLIGGPSGFFIRKEVKRGLT